MFSEIQVTSKTSPGKGPADSKSLVIAVLHKIILIKFQGTEHR